jgi:hypothetical protein
MPRPGRAAAETASCATRALAVVTGSLIAAASRSANWSRYPASATPSGRRAWALAAAAAIAVGIFSGIIRLQCPPDCHHSDRFF